MRRMTVGTEESGSQSEPHGCWEVSAGQERVRACPRGRLRIEEELRKTLGSQMAKGTRLWPVPWQGRGAAPMGYYCRFSPPGKTDEEHSLSSICADNTRQVIYTK